MGNRALKTIPLGTLSPEQTTFFALKLFEFLLPPQLVCFFLAVCILRVPGPVLEFGFNSRETSRREFPESGAE